MKLQTRRPDGTTRDKDAIDRAQDILTQWDRDCRAIHERFLADCARTTAAFEEAMK